MSKEKQQNGTGIVVGSVSRGQALRHGLVQRGWLVMSMVIGILVLAAGCWWLWSVTHKADKGPATISTSKSTVNLLRRGDLNMTDQASKEKLEDALQDTTSQQDKITLYSALATNAQARGDYQEMVNNLLKAFDAGDHSSTSILAIATTYENNLKDLNNALKYYKLAREAAQKEKSDGDPYADDQLKYIEDAIKAVEAKGAH